MQHSQPQARRTEEWARVAFSRANHAATIVAVYVLATLATDAYFMADTKDYVDSVMARLAGGDYEFWEFGHLFWRPLAWVFHQAAGPVTGLFLGQDPRAQVTAAFITLTWLAGLASAVLLHAWLRRLSPADSRVPLGIGIAFIFSHGFLNDTQTGAAYVAGLAFLLLGLYLMARRDQAQDVTLRTALMAGLALAGAVCIWVPYVLVVPAAIISPLLFFGFERHRLKLSILAGLTSAVATGCAYLVVAGAIGIHDLAGFREWMAAAAHETDITGIARMAFGFGRSFIHMGNDGAIVKRYMVGDPYNPIGLADLLRLSLWKLLLFYFCLVAVAGNLLVSVQGRKALAFATAGAGPILALAILYDGGAVERYLPLFPAVFVAVAASLWSDRSIPLARYVTIAFVVIMMVVDTRAMAKPVLQHEQDVTAARINELQTRLGPADRVVTVNWQDDLINFGRSFPFHPFNRTGTLRLWALVTPGTAQMTRWREDFALRAQQAWDDDGTVWVSTRVLSPRPLADWNWVEGDDERASWMDFYEFFEQLETGERVGGDDGFFLLLPSQANRELLDQLAPAGSL